MPAQSSNEVSDGSQYPWVDSRAIHAQSSATEVPQPWSAAIDQDNSLPAHAIQFAGASQPSIQGASDETTSPMAGEPARSLARNGSSGSILGTMQSAGQLGNVFTAN